LEETDCSLAIKAREQKVTGGRQGRKNWGKAGNLDLKKRKNIEPRGRTKRVSDRKGETRREIEKKSRGGQGITELGREIIQRGANFLPLFLLKETKAFVPHDREARTREEKGDWAKKKRTKNTEEPREINPETRVKNRVKTRAKKKYTKRRREQENSTHSDENYP
jgi:hypothetical protein